MKLLHSFLLYICMVMGTISLSASAENLGIAEDATVLEKRIVVVIPSYNNQRWYVRNLASVLSQNYTNFRVIYTDDCSPDETGRCVEEYLIDNDPDKKVSLIKNSYCHGGLHNLYSMIHSCDDDGVLKRLNAVYSSDEIWMTYGQFQWSSSGVRGWAQAFSDDTIKNNAFRVLPILLPTHLRTFLEK